MGICIGEFNHKYYILFLYTFLANSIVSLVEISMMIKEEVTIDAFGVEHLSIYYYGYALVLILLYFGLVLLIYLTAYHSYYLVTNQTTWEFFKRDSIPYLRGIDHSIAHPFSKGLIGNVMQLFGADLNKPINW